MHKIQKYAALCVLGGLMLGCSGKQVSESTSTTEVGKATDATKIDTIAEARKMEVSTTAAAEAVKPAFAKYIGKYKMEAPTPGFDFVTINQEKGLLMAKPSETETYELTPEKEDEFAVLKVAGKLKFTPAGKKIVDGFLLTLDGKDYRGKKE